MRRALSLWIGLGAASCFTDVGSTVTTAGSTGTSTSLGDPSSAASSSGTSTSTSADTTSTTQETGSSSSSSSSSGTNSSSETGSEEASTGNDAIVFFDDFERSDGAALGNDWFERGAGAFELAGGRVVPGPGPYPSFRGSLFYRPFSEALLNAEASVEFEVGTDPITPAPQLHARIQEADIGEMGTLHSYILFSNAPDILFLERATGMEAGTSLASVAVTPPISPGITYRLRLSVTGEDVVQLRGELQTLDETSGAWDELATLSFDDADPQRHSTPGSFGASTNNRATFSYDNFTITPLR